MPIIRKTREELKNFQLTPEQKARLDAMTDEEITAAALSDPDNPPITDEEWARNDPARIATHVGLRLDKV